MKRGIFYLLFVAFGVRIIWFFLILYLNPAGFREHDSFQYLAIARNLTEHHSFSQSAAATAAATAAPTPPLIPDPYRTPLYPLFLAIILFLGGGDKTTVILQILISVATAWLGYKITYLLTKKEMPSLITAAILAVDIPSIVYANLLMTETLFVFIFTLSVYLFLKFLKEKTQLWYLAGSAIALGLAALCRPIALFLPVVFVAVLVIQFRKHLLNGLKYSGILSGLFLLLISTWYIRNYLVFNHFFFSLIGNINLCHFQAAYIRAEKNGVDFYDARQDLWNKINSEYPGDYREDIAGYSNYVASMALKICCAEPALFIKHQAGAMIHFFFKPVRAGIDKQIGFLHGFNSITETRSFFSFSVLNNLFTRSSPVASAAVVFQWILMFMTYGLVLWGLKFLMTGNDKITILFIILLLIYFSGMTVPPLTDARFRLPVMPIISILAGCGVSRLKFHRNFDAIKEYPC